MRRNRPHLAPACTNTIAVRVRSRGVYGSAILALRDQLVLNDQSGCDGSNLA